MRVLGLLFLAAALVPAACSSEPPPKERVAAGRSADRAAWVATDSMRHARAGHSATSLPDGRVLLVGGGLGITGDDMPEKSCLIYDPTKDHWSAGGLAHQFRWSHTATLVLAPLGPRVLVVGSAALGAAALSSELYDAEYNVFRTGPGAGTPFSDHTATLLGDGRVLVVGMTTSIYDPAENTWTMPTQPLYTRALHAAVRLDTGRVLLVGNAPGFGAPNSLEEYDPETEAWRELPPLSQGRGLATATRLEDGRVLIAGGYDSGTGWLNAAEIYDPETRQSLSIPPMARARGSHTATRLADGTVIVVGGRGADGPIADAELFDPALGRFKAAPSMKQARSNASAALLEDGSVLVAGGLDPGGFPLASSERYLGPAPPPECTPGVCGGGLGGGGGSGGGDAEDKDVYRRDTESKDLISCASGSASDSSPGVVLGGFALFASALARRVSKRMARVFARTTLRFRRRR